MKMEDTKEGTLSYSSPNALSEGPPRDIFSLGLIVLEVLNNGFATGKCYLREWFGMVCKCMILDGIYVYYTLMKNKHKMLFNIPHLTAA